MVRRSYNFENIPPELREELLCWLPVKDLLRFRAVCRSWKTLIDTLQFKRKHFQAQTHHHQSSLFIWRYGSSSPSGTPSVTLRSLSPYTSADDSSSLGTIAPPPRSNCTPVGVVNGIFYLKCKSFHVIWNPATKESMQIDNPPWGSWYQPINSVSGLSNNSMVSEEIQAFGFDPIAEDYKFIMCRFATDLNSFPNTRALVEVYSRNDNSWWGGHVDAPFVKGLVSSSYCFLDGISYWFAKTCGRCANLNSLSVPEVESFIVSDGGSNSVPGLVGFNFSNEQFGLIELPAVLSSAMDCVPVVDCGSLGVMATFGDSMEDNQCEMWVMGGGEDGSWSKKFMVGLHPEVGKPRLFWNGGVMVFDSQTGENDVDKLVLINPTTGSCENPRLSGSEFRVFAFMESLFTINQGQFPNQGV